MSLRRAVHRRVVSGTWAAVLFSGCLAASTAAQAPSSAPAERGATYLAQFVPADTGFYVEAAEAGDLLLGLAQPELWATLAEIAGQPAGAEDTTEWAQRVEQSLGMKPREAIRLLLANRVAFAAGSGENEQDAIILCTPTRPLNDYLKTWNASPLSHQGAAAVYRLRSGVGLALSGPIACFGDPRPAAGVFARVVQCLDGGSSERLSQQAAYRALLQRVPEAPAAILFARLDPMIIAPAPTHDEGFGRSVSSAPSSQPFAGQPSLASVLPLPQSLRGSQHVLLAMHRDRSRLDFRVTGDAPPPAEDRPAFSPVVVAPADCLLSWQGSIEYSEMLELGRTLPDRNVLRIALRILERTAGLYEFAQALGSSTALFIGAQRDDSAARGAPATPVIGIAIHLDDESTAERRLQTLSDAASVYNLLALNNGWPLLEGVRALVLDGVAVQTLDLRPLWRGLPAERWISDVQLCWTIYDGALLVATSPQWMTHMIAARRAIGAGVSAAAQPGDSKVTVPQHGLYLASGRLGRLARDWLDHFATQYPELLNESWWLERQPGLKNPQLGLIATQNTEQRWLEVTQVQPASPARGVLRPGDRIIGANGKRFASTQPAEEFRRGIQDRERAGWLELMIEREGQPFLRRIRLPFIDPAQLLRRLSAIGELVEQIAFVDQRDSEGYPTGLLTLELADHQPAPLASRPAASAKSSQSD